MDGADGRSTDEGSEAPGKTVTEKPAPEPFVPRQVSSDRVGPSRSGSTAGSAPQGMLPPPAGSTGTVPEQETGAGTRLPVQRQGPPDTGQGEKDRSKRPVRPSARPPRRASNPPGPFAIEYALARRPPMLRNRAGMLVAGVALAVLSAAGVLTYLALDDGTLSSSQLPARVDGLDAIGESEQERGVTRWERSASDEVGSTVISRDYASASTGRTLRLVAARTDLTGLLELGWAADLGTPVGEGRCTRSLDPTGQGEPEVRPTMLLCWRTSEALSVYGIAIDQDRRPSEAGTMATVQDLWAELSS